MGIQKGGNLLNFGAYGLKALTPARITSRQIESARRCISRHLKRSGRVWIRIFPDVPVTKKPAEVRQGKGKGAVEFLGCKESNLEKFCLKLMVFPKIWQKRRSLLHQPNFQIKTNLLKG